MSAAKKTNSNDVMQAVLFGLVVLVVSFFTHMYNYQNPANLFWDENYHIASAQKYIHGIFFMEPHPPLGKLVIAAGEVLLQPNKATDQFIDTDYGKHIDEGFSFAGYRLFPTILGWLIAPMMYVIFLLLTRNMLFALLLSFFYIFDNALIVHHRSAMLESTLLFGCAAMLLLYLLTLEWKKDPKRVSICSALLGMAFGITVTTKANGLIMILLLPALLWQLWPKKKVMLKSAGLFLVGFAVVFVGVWHTHFSLGGTVDAKLSNSGYYQASTEYKSILREGTQGSIQNFPFMIREHLAFLPHYSRGVPKLDLCKGDENGSPWFLWPIGARSISYRWDNVDTDMYKYLYLQSNPATWLLGFAGVLVAASLLVVHLFVPVKQKLQNPYHLIVFLGLYASYMIAMSRITRVMYLYHYFIPLLLSFCLFGLVFVEIKQFWKWKLDEGRKLTSLIIIASIIFTTYQFYRPLTYYEPITNTEFKMRQWFRLWDLKCANCDKDSPLVRKSC